MIACELISALLSGDFVRKHPLVVKVAMIAIKAAIKIGAAQLAVQIPSASLEVLDSMTDSLLTDTLAIAYEEEAADSGAAGGAVDRAFMKRDIGVTVEAIGETLVPLTAGEATFGSLGLGNLPAHGYPLGFTSCRYGINHRTGFRT